MSFSTKDYLWLNLRELPYFRAMLRAVEARAYEDISLSPPILDLGCGDGHFASIAFNQPITAGVDPWLGPLRQAARRKVNGHPLYSLPLCAEGAHLPFPNQFFKSAISNSVLEHIEHLEPVLAEVQRVLCQGAPFVFCVPNHNFLPSLSIAKRLDRMGLHWIAERYRAFFNFIARHHHCDSPQVWQARLEQAGFTIERYWHYFSPQAFAIFEWGHAFGLPSLITHKLFQRWILAPTAWNLFLTRRLVQFSYDEDPIQAAGVCTFYITRRL